MRKRAGGLVATAAALIVLGPGCGPVGESDDDRAADAAATYRSDLEAFATDVQKAAKQQFVDEDESKKQKSKGSGDGKKSSDPKGKKGKKRKKGKPKDQESRKRKPTPLELAVAEPPELPEIDSDDPSYVAAQAIDERLGPMVDELAELGGVNQERDYYFNLDVETEEYDFGADVISRSTDYLFNDNVDVSVFGTDEQLAKLAEQAIAKEVNAWPKFRKQIARVKSRTDIHDSYKGFELDEIDREIALFREYQKHLRQVPARAAQLAYYDDIWPDEDPVRLGASGSFNSLGNPYFKSLAQGERIVRSMTDDLSELARTETIDDRTPYVGDAYRDAIIAGYIPARDEKYKYRVAQVNYRAWMLYRIQELEDTPKETYEAARQTIYLELLEDSRNTYDTFLALFAGFSDIDVFGARDIGQLKTYIDLASTELAGTYPPLLEPTRRGFLRALDIIDLDIYGTAYGKIGSGINALEETFDARDKAEKQFEQARKKIVAVLKDGAKAADSNKKAKASLKDVVAATRPGAGEDEETDNPEP